jgi:MoaA/NifB/PqqE/SkfB family radical SAM enzyme
MRDEPASVAGRWSCRTTDEQGCMESIYWVMAWACHRKCRHCYEDRFRPYVRGALADVVAEAEANFPRIVANLPDKLTYLDRTAPNTDGTLPERDGRIILSGGEALLEATRERITYKVIEALVQKYPAARIVVQTTGDLLTPRIVRDLMDRGVWMISVAGVDDFHVGMEGAERQAEFTARLVAMFEDEGIVRAGSTVGNSLWHQEPGPVYSFFGATPDMWIGKLWPRGRAWTNSLSTAGMEDNFCARWSGGLRFLEHRFDGSEVSIEPDGSVYPCCIKTKLPIGNVVEERLIDILDSLADDPVYAAINAGAPERMGLQAGWSVAEFRARSRTTLPDGRPYENLCIGCDRFHEEVLAPVFAAARTRRLVGAPQQAGVPA